MSRRRPSAHVVVSVAFHVVAIVGLAHVLAIPTHVAELFRREHVAVRAERIGFLRLPGTTASSSAGVSGGDGRTLQRAREQRGLVAPVRIPVGIPPVTQAEAPLEPASGPLIGLGGPAQGVRPGYRDARLWREPVPVVVAPRSVRETVETMIASDVARLTDSLAAIPPRRAPGDWTFERNGQKYGIDQKYIRLGPISIPTAVLALLPLNVQGNPTTIERERAISYMSRDIQYHAQRAISEDEFRRAVRNLRERKERERLGREQEPAEQPADKTKERQGSNPAAPRDLRAN